jgi:hypothetical protein
MKSYENKYIGLFWIVICSSILGAIIYGVLS